MTEEERPPRGTYPKGTEWEHVFHDAMENSKGKEIYNIVIAYGYKDDEGDISTAYFSHGSHYGTTGLIHSVLTDREKPLEDA